MCGIIGIIGGEPVAPLLIDALKRLEYRGYDSAGIATLEDGALVRRRAQGKLKNLEQKLAREPLAGSIGIGHTRWATHGRPTEVNAHPHATDRLAVVHNGIIENFAELRRELEGKGVKFSTETDTEVVAHLVSAELERGLSPLQAVMAALPRLRGAFALAFLFAGEDNLLIRARKGSPLAVGVGDKMMFVGPGAIALAAFTDMVSYLEDGDCVVVSRAGAEVRDAAGRVVERPVVKSQASVLLLDKGNHRHFMAKEIYEQPEVVGHTLAHYLDMVAERVELPLALAFDFRALTRVSIAACGTAYYAGMVAKYWFERFARLPVDVDIASEFRYRDAPLERGGLAIFVSQSGETADTLASLREARARGQHVLSVVNVPTSTIARESDIVMPTLAGPEIGVASTKAFTCQLAALACLAIAAGRARGVLSEDDEKRLVRALIEIPRHLTEALALEPQIEQLARDLAKSRDVLYLGRGTSYPIALEGALKLKEISYIHAEGYAAGELKQGPIALMDETIPVVVIAPHDRVFEKTVSNMQEVAARGGRLILVTDPEGAAAAAGQSAVTLTLPTMPATVGPLVYAVPGQLIAYQTAVILLRFRKEAAAAVARDERMTDIDRTGVAANVGTAKPTTGVAGRLRNYFLTGLVVAGPVAVTAWLIWWFVTWVDNLVRPLIPQSYRPETYLPVNIPGFGLIIVFVVLTLLGFLTANFVGNRLVNLGDDLLGHMPVVRPIYRTIKQIFQTLFSSSDSSFRQVGLVEFPAPGMWSVVFLTQPPSPEVPARLPQSEHVSAFLPCTR